MSTRQCSINGCEKQHWGLGWCKMHYYRVLRHGDPYVERKAKCDTCLRVARTLRRPATTQRELVEQLTDLYLLFKSGSDYRLKDYDAQGREYDLEEELHYAK